MYIKVFFYKENRNRSITIFCRCIESNQVWKRRIVTALITMSSHLMVVIHFTVWALGIISSTLCLTAEAKFPKRLIPHLQKPLPSSGVIKNKGILFHIILLQSLVWSDLYFDEICAKVVTACHFTTSYQFEPRVTFMVDFPRFVTQSNE